MKTRHLLALLSLIALLTSAACGKNVEQRCADVVDKIFSPHLRGLSDDKSPVARAMEKRFKAVRKHQIAYCVDKGGPTDEQLECLEKSEGGIVGAIECLDRAR